MEKETLDSDNKSHQSCPNNHDRMAAFISPFLGNLRERTSFTSHKSKPLRTKFKRKPVVSNISLLKRAASTTDPASAPSVSVSSPTTRKTTARKQPSVTISPTSPLTITAISSSPPLPVATNTAAIKSKKVAVLIGRKDIETARTRYLERIARLNREGIAHGGEFVRPAVANRVTSSMSSAPNKQEESLSPFFKRKPSAEDIVLSDASTNIQISLQELENVELDPEALSMMDSKPPARTLPKVSTTILSLPRSSALGHLVDKGILSKQQAFSLARTNPLLMEYEYRPNSALDRLVDFGIEPSRVARLVSAFPLVLSYHIEGRFAAVLKCLGSLGLKEQEIAEMVTKYPPVLGLCPEKNLPKKIDFFRKLKIPDLRIGMMLHRSPHILGFSLEQCYVVKLNYLRSLGMSESDLRKLIITSPFVFGLGLEACIGPKLDYIRSLGVPPSSIPLILARQGSILGLALDQIKSRVKFFSELGLKTEQISKLIQSHPQVLACSVENNMRPKLSFYIEDAKVVSKDKIDSFILTYPALFNYSLEQRLWPRLLFLRKLRMESRVSMNSLCYKTDAQFASSVANRDLSDFVKFRQDVRAEMKKAKPVK